MSEISYEELKDRLAIELSKNKYAQNFIASVIDANTNLQAHVELLSKKLQEKLNADPVSV